MRRTAREYHDRDRGRVLPWREIPAPARPSVSQVKPNRKRVTPPRAKQKWVPGVNHPWRAAVRREVQKRDAAIIDLASAWPLYRFALRAPQGFTPGKVNDEQTTNDGHSTEKRGRFYRGKEGDILNEA